jgi:exportin-T
VADFCDPLVSAAWIDITLTVTPHALFLLNRLLQHAHIPFRLLALDALSRIVLKGMKDPGEKLQLLSFLSIGSALGPLEQATAQTGLALADRDEAIDVFRERMAKLLNNFGIELGKMVTPDALAEEATKREAEQMLEACLPLFLRLLGDEHPETSSAVFGFLDDILKRVRYPLSLTCQMLPAPVSTSY